ncbi:hypothetical protein QUF88_17665 [Bacillus sp. DX1.1]|uniref:hypothetical protein n=1 Tax=unclassified Bacillus (in: firmicutes) TaxID=185979 RepID=UPI002570CE8E|nr:MULTISPECIES: hypothetical protein [unclassified Bacillus (in: firmicutes)]MDM5155555.1 hypothetical protein [Bacillus sp. DX1.1]WJE84199.1 hypothetical protein QRE67_15190 [Bacillus sp. DX3.1]
MSVSISDELQLFAQEIQSLLSPNILHNIARDVGFVQRASKGVCVAMGPNHAISISGH